MKKNSAWFVLVAFLVFTPLQEVIAKPFLYTDCPISRRGVEGLVLFDKNCSTGYVFPPPVASLRIVSALVSVSNIECASARTLESIAVGNILEREKYQRELNEELRNSQKQLRSEIDRRRRLRPIRDLLSRRQSSITSDYSAAKEEFEADCEGAEPSELLCDAMESRVGALARELEDVANRHAHVQRDHAEAIAMEAKLEARIAVVKAKLEQLRSDAIPTSDPARDRALVALDLLAKRAGVTVAFTLTSDIRRNLSMLQRRNRNSGMNFTEMRWDSGSLHVAPLATTVTQTATSYSQLIVPGLIQNSGTLFINASGARLDLDAYSACRVFNFQRPDPNNLSEIAKSLAANVVGKAYLRYSALIDARIEARFDYRRFYEFLVETRSRNGLFRTRKIRQVVENLSGQGVISVSVEDAKSIMSPSEKNALVEAIRNNLVQRAMDALDAEYVGVNPDLEARTPRFGAPVLSKELRKCANKWCQAGAAVVDVAHAVFGGSNQREAFAQSLQFLTVETYSDVKAFPLVVDIAFEPRR